MRPRLGGRLLMGGGILAALMGAGILWMALQGGGGFRGDTAGAHVLLITVDALRADHLGAYGHREIRTPVIDTLADEGVMFETAVTPSVTTRSAHASILTGTYPPAHRVRADGDFRLGGDALTLAEVLRSRGYRTGAAVGSFLLDSSYGLDQGFDQYDDTIFPSRPSGLAERPARDVTDAALRFLKGALPSSTFLWVHYFDPHYPYAAPSPFREQYGGRPYDAEIAFVDAEIGRLLAGLGELGIRGRTLVALVADHGEGLGDHGEDTHGALLYEESTRVPLVISFPPHLPSGRRVAPLVRTVDLMPTILELVRIDPRQAAAPAQGVSLWPLMADASGETASTPAYIEAMEPLLLYGWSPLTSIRDERYKYIEAPRPELYDLSADPRERANLAASLPEVASGYRARLEALRSAVAPAGGGDRGLPEGPSAPVDVKDKTGMLKRIHGVLGASSAGQHDRAVREAASILSESPDLAPVRLYLASSLAALGRHEETIRELRALLARSPRDTEALAGLAWSQVNARDFDGARATLDRILAISPDHVEALAGLGHLAMMKGDYAEAARAYKKALTVDPAHLPSILTLAGMYEAGGKLHEAGVFYARAVEVAPSSVDGWMSLGWVRFREGKPEEALAALERAQALAPEAPELQVAAGDALLAMGRLDQARAAYSKGAEARLPAAFYGLGMVEMQAGNYGPAARLLRQAVALRPDKVAWQEDLKRALAGAGR